MKKLLSIVLALLMVLPMFSLVSIAEETGETVNYDFVHGNIYYKKQNSEEVYAVAYRANETSQYDSYVKLSIPETVNGYKVTGIADEAFYGCPFTEIQISRNIKYIGDRAFALSWKLDEIGVFITCNFEHFGVDVFLGTPLEEKLYSKKEQVFGQNLLFSYTGDEEEYTLKENITLLAPKCFAYSKTEKFNLGENITEIPTLAFWNCQNLKSIVLPDNIVTIGEGAFKDCVNLKEITFGKNLEDIFFGAFANTAVEKLHLPLKVKNIAGAFADCKTIESITVEWGNRQIKADENALYEDVDFNYVDKEGVLKVGHGFSLAYYFPKKVKSKITLPVNVNAISNYAFYHLKGVDEIYADDIQFIGIKAFSGSSIKLFEFSGGCNIDNSAFLNCKNLETIYLSDVYYIGVSAFENCTALQNIHLSENISTVGGLAFRNTGLTEVEISGIECYVGEGVFKECAKLKKVSLLNGVNYLGQNAFQNCPELKKVYLSETIEEFADNALRDCENVEFDVIRGTAGHKLVRRLGYDFQIVGSLPFFELVADFFRSVFDFLFGWMRK